MKRPVILVGAGGHARVVLEALLLIGRTVKGCIAPHPPKNDWSKLCPYLGTDDVLQRLGSDYAELVLGVGAVRGGSTRKNHFTRFLSAGYQWAGITHPTAVIAADAIYAAGVQIMAAATIQSGVAIGENVIINTGAIIEHDCRIGPHSHVATGAILCGDVTVGEMAHIGAGAIILQGLEIGAGATVGAGALVTKSVPAGKTVVGNPAKILEK